MNELYSFEANPYILADEARQPRTGMLRNLLGRAVSSWSQPQLNEGYDPSKIPTGANQPYKKAGFFRSLIGDESNKLNAAAAQRYVDMQHAGEMAKLNEGGINRLADVEARRIAERDKTLHGYDTQRDLANDTRREQAESRGLLRQLIAGEHKWQRDETSAERESKRKKGEIAEQKKLAPEQKGLLKAQAEAESAQAEYYRGRRGGPNSEYMRPISLGENMIFVNGEVVQIDPLGAEPPKVVWPPKPPPRVSPEDLQQLEGGAELPATLPQQKGGNFLRSLRGF